MSEQNYANVQQQAELMKYISDNMKIPVLGAGGGFAPIGVGNWYFGSVAPQGWLICDGTTYNIADYPDLATFFASNYESANAFGGDGVTTFAVPDLRGEFIRMIGTNSHTNQGDGGELSEHQDGSELPFFTTTSSIGIDRLPVLTGVTAYKADSTWKTGAVKKGNQGLSNESLNYDIIVPRPTNTSLNFIIKATVSGDDKSHQYSTDEQIVGTTEDGEFIYEKTIKVTTETPTTLNTWVSITPQLDELENAILRTIQISKGDVGGSQVFNFLSNRIYNKTVQVYNVGVVTRLIVGSVVTIQYTKTS